MTYYAGIDLSMKTTAICVVDDTGMKISQTIVDSTADAIAEALSAVGRVERCVVETGRMSSAICSVSGNSA